MTQIRASSTINSIGIGLVFADESREHPLRETIRLGERDSVAVARSKLEAATFHRVALVVPAGCQALRDRVSMALIRRQAEALALDLVLVTPSDELADLARQAGLRVSSSEAGAQRMRRVRAQAVPIAHPAPLPSRHVGQGGEGQTVSSINIGLGSKAQMAAVAAAGAVLLLCFLAMVIILPSATVVLEPVGASATAEVDVVASAAAPQGGDWVPARVVEIELMDVEASQTTGRQSAPDQRATGEVVFANKSTEAITVTKGTIVRTTAAEPVRFYTLLDVAVPAGYGAVARVPIMAFEPGPAGNVDALTIRAVEGEIGLQVDVLNDEPTRGGSDKRVNIVTAEDCDRVRAQLLQRMQQDAYNALVGQLAPGEWVPPDGLDLAIVDEIFDARPAEPADTLNLTMTVRVAGLAVDGQATRDLIVQRLEAQEGGGRVVNKATLQVDQPVGGVEVLGQTIHFRARGSAILVEPIDRHAVGTHLAGQPLRAATEWLSGRFDLREAPEVRISPAWWPRMPWLSGRIRIELAGGV